MYYNSSSLPTFYRPQHASLYPSEYSTGSEPVKKNSKDKSPEPPSHQQFISSLTVHLWNTCRTTSKKDQLEKQLTQLETGLDKALTHRAKTLSVLSEDSKKIQEGPHQQEFLQQSIKRINDEFKKAARKLVLDHLQIVIALKECLSTDKSESFRGRQVQSDSGLKDLVRSRLIQEEAVLTELYPQLFHSTQPSDSAALIGLVNECSAESATARGEERFRLLTVAISRTNPRFFFDNLIHFNFLKPSLLQNALEEACFAVLDQFSITATRGNTSGDRALLSQTPLDPLLNHLSNAWSTTAYELMTWNQALVVETMRQVVVSLDKLASITNLSELAILRELYAHHAQKLFIRVQKTLLERQANLLNETRKELQELFKKEELQGLSKKDQLQGLSKKDQFADLARLIEDEFNLAASMQGKLAYPREFQSEKATQYLRQLFPHHAPNNHLPEKTRDVIFAFADLAPYFLISLVPITNEQFKRCLRNALIATWANCPLSDFKSTDNQQIQAYFAQLLEVKRQLSRLEEKARPTRYEQMMAVLERLIKLYHESVMEDVLLTETKLSESLDALNTLLKKARDVHKGSASATSPDESPFFTKDEKALISKQNPIDQCRLLIWAHLTSLMLMADGKTITISSDFFGRQIVFEHLNKRFVEFHILLPDAANQIGNIKISAEPQTPHRFSTMSGIYPFFRGQSEGHGRRSASIWTTSPASSSSSGSRPSSGFNPDSRPTSTIDSARNSVIETSRPPSVVAPTLEDPPAFFRRRVTEGNLKPEFFPRPMFDSPSSSDQIPAAKPDVPKTSSPLVSVMNMDTRDVDTSEISSDKPKAVSYIERRNTVARLAGQLDKTAISNPSSAKADLHRSATQTGSSSREATTAGKKPVVTATAEKPAKEPFAQRRGTVVSQAGQLAKANEAPSSPAAVGGVFGSVQRRQTLPAMPKIPPTKDDTSS